METLASLRKHIAEIQKESPLAAEDIILLGASKGHAAPILEQAILAGLTDFGENRVQEAQDKWPLLKAYYPSIRLHLIGPLQTNKVKEALELFDVIQTLDRPKLADEIAKHPMHAVKQFYIQVNTGEELQKAGIAPKEANDFIAYCTRVLALPVVGLMCVPPADEPAAPHFALLRNIALANGLTQLSMGMSNDYETAIRMGSRCVRIGTALFGKRD